MDADRHSGILGFALAVLATAELGGCGGIGGGTAAMGTATSSGVGVVTQSTSGSSPSAPSSSGSGSSTTASPSTAASPGTTGGSSISVAGGTTILFAQPEENGIAGSLFVPTAVHRPPPKGMFEMILWQPDPASSNGQLVPTSWDAGSQTGFIPSTSLSTAQLGFRNNPGTSTAQMDGDTVGAFLNSADLPGSPAGQKMMITPQYIWSAGNQPIPFSGSTSELNAGMDLQIPTTMGDSTYVSIDFLFEDPNGVRISYGVKIFNNGHAHPIVGGTYNTDAKAYQLNSPLGVDQRYVTEAPGSGSATSTPWLGWRHFEWSINQTQFVAALNYLVSQNPGIVQSTDPTKYVLAEVHLNAEFHFQPNPAELGWSMRRWRVWVSG